MPTRTANRRGTAEPRRKRPRLSTAAAGVATPEFRCVAIGASAGGLDACRKLVAALPHDGSLACILVQHLEPNHESLMVDLLADHTALSQHEVETEVDRYISWPGQALSYKLGEMKIVELRAKAEKALGSKFDLRAFHDAVLAEGSVPLPVLEQRIDAFIARQSAK